METVVNTTGILDLTLHQMAEIDRELRLTVIIIGLKDQNLMDIKVVRVVSTQMFY